MTGRLTWVFVSFIAYTYAGYPLLLALLARLRPERRFVEEPPPSMTLLIAAHNEESVIAGKLENSLSLNYPQASLQILVAADGSDDRTADVVRGYHARGVELTYQPLRQGKARAINQALSKVRGDIVVFSDANNLYDQETLRELVKPFSNSRVGAATGAKIVLQDDGDLGESEGLYWRYESFIKDQETRLSSCTAAAGEILAVRRELIDALPEETINDDFYLIMRVIRKGFDVIYVPTARSLERVSASPGEEVARRARIVAGRYQAMRSAGRLLPLDRPLVLWQILSHKFFRPLVPLAMIGAFLSNLTSVMGFQKNLLARPRWRQRTGVLLLYLQLAFYGFALSARWVAFPGRLGKMFYLPAFLVDSNWAAIVGLVRFVRGSQPSRWRRVGRRDQEILAPMERGEDRG